MIIGDILNALERLAPLSQQEPYDNSGLQVGLTRTETAGVLFCLDVTESVVDEASEEGFNLIVSHHPLIFNPIKSVTDRTSIGRCIIKAISNGIAIYSAHTCLDNDMHGVNAMIASKIGLRGLRILRPMSGSLMKLVTFVPKACSEALLQALFDAGCGNIGDYDSCSFAHDGIGTFRAKEGANPYVGDIGELHREPETRIEAVFSASSKAAVLEALLKNHPYETPAYDIYPIDSATSDTGSGMIGTLDTPVRASDFMRQIKSVFGIGSLGYSGDAGRMVSRVALCGGAGAFLIPDALRAGADIFLTGEIKYHEFGGNDDRILLVEMGHYESEQFTQHLLLDAMQRQFPSVKMKITERGTNLKKYI